MLGTVKLFNIYVGDFTSSPLQRKTVSVVDHFSAYFGQSDVYNVMSSYYQVINGTKTYVTAALQYVKSYNAMPSAKGIFMDQGIVVAIILDAIKSNSVPLDINGIYAVIFRGDFQFSGFLSVWCGYHGTLPLVTTNGESFRINYFAIGDPETALDGNGIYCEQILNNTANGSLGGDSLVNIYSHEVEETVTNYDQKGWYFDSSNTCLPGTCAGFENADFCNWSFNTDVNSNSNMVIGGKPYLIQSLWQPGYGCVLSKQ